LLIKEEEEKIKFGSRMKDLAPPQFKWKNSQGMSFNVFLISIDIKHQKRKKKMQGLIPRMRRAKSLNSRITEPHAGVSFLSPSTSGCDELLLAEEEH
jgi:uncharacterized protein (DUF2235 family)